MKIDDRNMLQRQKASIKGGGIYQGRMDTVVTDKSNRRTLKVQVLGIFVFQLIKSKWNLNGELLLLFFLSVFEFE